ncbi:hypothetical protein [Sphingobium ummariense]
MSFLSSIVTSTGRVVLSLDLPMAPQSSGARGDAARSMREDNWENEGGHLAVARPAISSSAVLASDIDILEAQVNFMESALAGDFANGRIGMRYNSYAHRSRVLRQQQAKLDALRATFLAQEKPS